MPAFPEERLALEPGCSRCPALVDSRQRIAWGNGSRDATVMVVGEAPAAGNPDLERWQGGNHTGLAYTSRHSGRRIRELIEAVGYDGETFYTNAVKCFPAAPGSEQATNREPTATERESCRGHLRTELRHVDPRVLLPTGKHATMSVTAVTDHELTDFLSHVLEPFRCPDRELTVIPLLHPAYDDVWLPRIGYDRREYIEALRTQLDQLLAGRDG